MHAALDCFVATAPRNDGRNLLGSHNETASCLHNGEPPKRNTLHRRYIELAAKSVTASRRNHPRFYETIRLQAAVWYEVHETMYNAITREKQIKAGSRIKKLALIETMNHSWRDLFEDIAT
jgi:predicted GIY-YIG superfamily endonuclease